jgi:hypothetical protein
MLSANVLFGQELKEVQLENRLSWYGIDFSNAHFLDFENEKSEIKELVNLLSLNPLSDKYKEFIRRKFKKDYLDIKNENSFLRNSTLNYDSISSGPNDLTINDIRNIVSQYNIDGDGFGVLYIVEELYKERLYVWTVYIEESSKTVLSTRRFVVNNGSGISKDKWLKAIDRVVQLSSDQLRRVR